MSGTFDPTKYLRQLRGKGGTADYLDVKWRLVWLRSEHPDAITEIEHVEISPDVAIFKALVMIPGQGRATDYGSETPKDFGDYIEKAATKALGRALAQLGYGTQFVGFELDENTRIVESPVARKRGEDDDGNSAAQPAPPRAEANRRSAGPVARPDAPQAAETPALATGNTYSDAAIEARILAGYQRFEAGVNFAAIAARMEADWGNLTALQTHDVSRALDEIERKLAERDAALAARQPAAVGG